MSDIRIAITKNKKVVEINTIAFSGKRKIDWEAVEIYLKQYIGSKYVIEETGDTVYIGTDFPDEYTHSRYKEKSFGTIGKAKANATQAIPDLINTVSNLSFRRNFKGKHTADASKGWYYGEVHFSIPITDDKKRIIGRNTFRGRMIIRKNNDEKMYLSNIIDIKKRNVVARLGISHTVKNHISFFVKTTLIPNGCQEQILSSQTETATRLNHDLMAVLIKMCYVGNNGAEPFVKETVEYRSAEREDMPRKFLDKRFTDYSVPLVSKYACWPASGEDGFGQSPSAGSRDKSLAGS